MRRILTTVVGTLLVAACVQRSLDPLAVRFADVRLSTTREHRACVSRAAAPCEVEREEAVARDLLATSLPDEPRARRHLLALRDLRWTSDLADGLTRARAALERLHSERVPVVVGDLVAAYVLESDRSGSALPLFRAVEVLDRRPDSAPVTLFNRAIVFERLGLDRQAVDAWREYHRRDPASAWGAEALTRAAAIESRWNERARQLAALRAPTTFDSQRAEAEARTNHDAVWRLLLRHAAQWSRARLRGEDADAQREAVRVTQLAAALHPRAEPPGVARSAREAAPWLVRVVADGRSDSVLWHAHVDLVGGLDAFDSTNSGVAVQQFARASDGFRRAGSPFEAWAEFYRAAAMSDLGNFETADRILEQLVARDEGRVRAKALTSLGVSAVRRGRYAVAIQRYEEAVRALPTVEGTMEIGFLRSLLAESRHLLGDDEGAALDALSAQRVLALFRDATALPGHLAALADIARAQGLSLAATRIAREAVTLTARQPGGVDQAWSYSGLARNLAAADRLSEARAALDSAARALALVPDERVRDHLRSLILMDNAPLIASDPVRDTAWLAESERTLRRFQNGISLPLALQLTAERRLVSGDSTGARAALEDAARTLQQQARLMGDGGDRWRFDEAREGAFDALMRLRAAEGDPTDAFRWLEVLRDGDDMAPTQWSSRLRRALPARTATLTFLVLEDRLLSWFVGRQSERVAEVQVTRATLASHVDAVVDGRFDRAALRTLDSLLLAPFADLLPEVSRLHMVPDRELGRVPFAALWDGRAFLIEQRTPVVHASLTMLSRALIRRAAGTASGRLLAVAGPTTGVDGFAPLPHARSEISRVAALYPTSRVLADDSATITRVMAAATSVDVLHFAGHAAANLEMPERSFLLLADDPSHPAAGGRRWNVQAIRGLRAPRLRLVFLAACRTFGTRASHRVGAGSLADAFHQAGIEQIVSTLFEVGDADAETVALEFHRQLQRTGDAAAALRASQLQSLRSRPDVAWWAFVYSGS